MTNAPADRLDVLDRGPRQFRGARLFAASAHCPDAGPQRRADLVEVVGTDPVGGAGTTAEMTVRLLRHQPELTPRQVLVLAGKLAGATDVLHVPLAVRLLLAHPACTDRAVATALGLPWIVAQCANRSVAGAGRSVLETLRSRRHPIAAAVALRGCSRGVGADLVDVEQVLSAAGQVRQHGVAADLSEADFVDVVLRAADTWVGNDVDLLEVAVTVLVSTRPDALGAV